ncbi:MAG TPA: amidohydrolase family protein [Pyrinomonadaceae bacterium]|nr:amidohydrolase family protein [Pyrinomonadaceae bacterium]
MKKTIFAFFAIISLLSLSVFAQSYAITNAKIVTVSGAPIDKGTIIIRDGLIQNLGAGISIPADSQVIDASGLTVYPGFFDAASGVGIAAAQQQQGQGRGQGGGFPQQAQAQATQPQSNSNYPTGLQPEVSASNLIKFDDASVETARNGGFTTVLSVPRERIFNGQSALINTAGDSASEMILRSPVALHISFVPLGGGYPTSMMGSFSALRQIFLDAQRLQAWTNAYKKDPKGMKRPESDKSLEALFPLLNREVPAAFNANSQIEIIRVLDFAKEFNLVPVIVGGQEAWKVTDRLKASKATVLLSLNFPKRTSSNAPDADPEDLETLRFRVEVPKCAARLKQAGVPFAFQSGGATAADFLSNAAKTVENGLSKDDALRSMTLNSAKIFDVDDRLGSIEKGKIANLVVVRGDIFDRAKVITHVFVDGKMFEQKPPAPTGGRFQRPSGGGDAPTTAPTSSTLNGAWNITVEVPGQTITGTINFSQQGDRLTGNVATTLGTSEIKNGKPTADGGFTFDTSVSFGGQTFDVTYTGKVNGNQISGTVNTPQGAIPFSGTKKP